MLSTTVCREAWSAERVMHRHRALLQGYHSRPSAARASEVLGGGHPVARASERCTLRTHQAIVAVAFTGIGATLFAMGDRPLLIPFVPAGSMSISLFVLAAFAARMALQDAVLFRDRRRRRAGWRARIRRDIRDAEGGALPRAARADIRRLCRHVDGLAATHLDAAPARHAMPTRTNGDARRRHAAAPRTRAECSRGRAVRPARHAGRRLAAVQGRLRRARRRASAHSVPRNSNRFRLLHRWGRRMIALTRRLCEARRPSSTASPASRPGASRAALTRRARTVR